jgi:hypothetical protein
VKRLFVHFLSGGEGFFLLHVKKKKKKKIKIEAGMVATSSHLTHDGGSHLGGH